MVERFIMYHLMTITEVLYWDHIYFVVGMYMLVFAYFFLLTLYVHTT